MNVEYMFGNMLHKSFTGYHSSSWADTSGAEGNCLCLRKQCSILEINSDETECISVHPSYPYTSVLGP